MLKRRTWLAAVALLPAGLIGDGIAAPTSPRLLPGTPICRGGLGRRVAEGGGGGSADADFLEKLGLLEGHLLIGRALLEANESRLATPHFGHPIRELYTWLEPRITARGKEHFEAELEIMERFAEGGGRGTGGVFGQAWNALAPKLVAAKASVNPALLASPRFMLEHIALMVYDVASDYGESIERGRIINIVEYHDSMGFLMYSAATTQQQRATGRAGAEWTEVAGVLEDLRQKVYPNLLPGSRPPQSISAVRARSQAIRSIAERVPA